MIDQYPEIFSCRQRNQRFPKGVSTIFWLVATLLLALPIFPAFPQAGLAAGGNDKAEVLPSIREILPASVPASGFSGGKPLLQYAEGFGGETVLVPRTPASTAFVKQFAGSKAAKPFRIEVVAVLPPAGPDYSADDLPLMLQKLALIANSVHKLEGLEYWSASRKKMRTLYEESWRIASSEKPTKIPDPASVAELGPGPVWSFYTHQKDLTFGSSVGTCTVTKTANSMQMKNANVSSVKLLLIQMIAPGGLESGIYAIPCKEGLLLYAVTFIQATDLAAGRVFESGRNKAFAVFNWFVQEAAAAKIVKECDLASLMER
ncbi:MAG: hypothetical protein LLF89_07630 [Spirochaetaceae bacterium]|nr:hypothetical protein [Spirochaetaceae bacterium]